MVAGVAAGIAAHLGVSVVRVRVAFVLLLGSQRSRPAALRGVLGGPAAARPSPAADPPRARPRPAAAVRGDRPRRAPASRCWSSAPSGSPAPPAGWSRSSRSAPASSGTSPTPSGAGSGARRCPQVPWLGAVVDESDRRAFLLRFIGGGVLVAVGIIGVVAVYAPGGDFGAVLNGVIFALVGLAGVGVVAAPAAVAHVQPAPRRARGAHPRAGARRGRGDGARPGAAHARADPAQRRRRQERAAAGPRPGALACATGSTSRPASPTERFAAALEQAAAEVEDTYAITVETVVVGDRDDDERVGALVAAAREALVNAARHAEGADRLAVRRGRSRSSSACSSATAERASTRLQWRTTRHGVRGSIIGRMKRHGGQAEIRSEPGDGTEVRLTLPVTRDARRRRERQVSDMTDEPTPVDERETTTADRCGCSWSTTTRCSGPACAPSWARTSRWWARPARWRRRSAGSPRRARTWCCSTCTCPTAAAGRCWRRCAAPTRRSGSSRCASPTRPRT